MSRRCAVPVLALLLVSTSASAWPGGGAKAPPAGYKVVSEQTYRNKLFMKERRQVLQGRDGGHVLYDARRGKILTPRYDSMRITAGKAQHDGYLLASKRTGAGAPAIQVLRRKDGRVEHKGTFTGVREATEHYTSAETTVSLGSNVWTKQGGDATTRSVWLLSRPGGERVVWGRTNFPETRGPGANKGGRLEDIRPVQGWP